MTGPRYVLATVTGYPINISRHYVRASDARPRPGFTISVLDRVYCHREVAVFTSRSNRSEGNGGAMSSKTALRRATALCDRLNRLEAARGAQEAA